ncbi:MAG TPA: hypothetical protein PK771_09955, partial [Spirochaetota bacterium]|nr:hypothetical protein [Spirochaetota bacterium]
MKTIKFIILIIFVLTILSCGILPKIETTSSQPINKTIFSSDVSTDSVTINWESEASAEKYKIYRKANGENDYSLVAEVDSSVKKFTDKNLQSSKIYNYKVIVVNKFGEVNMGEPIIITTKSRFSKPDTPSDFSVALLTDYGVKLVWKPVANANFYKVYKKVNGVESSETIWYKTEFSDYGL